MLPSIARWYDRAHSAVVARDLDRLCPDASTLPSDFDLFDHQGGTPAQWLRTNEMRGHLQRMLIKVDRASMFHGLEVRVPFLDANVLGAAAALDPAHAVGKRPVRDALARHVPAATIPTLKRGFSLPVGAWLRRDLRPLLHERHIRDEALLKKCDGFIDQPLSEAYETRHPRTGP